MLFVARAVTGGGLLDRRLTCVNIDYAPARLRLYDCGTRDVYVGSKGSVSDLVPCLGGGTVG